MLGVQLNFWTSFSNEIFVPVSLISLAEIIIQNIYFLWEAVSLLSVIPPTLNVYKLYLWTAALASFDYLHTTVKIDHALRDYWPISREYSYILPTSAAALLSLGALPLLLWTPAQFISAVLREQGLQSSRIKIHHPPWKYSQKTCCKN